MTKLHLHRAGACDAGEDAIGAPQKAPAASDSGDDVASGCLDAHWLVGDERKYDLVVTMDDATSAIYSLFLVDQEGTASSLRRRARRWWRSMACSCSLYTDRGSHYFDTPEAGARVSKTVAADAISAVRAEATRC